MEEALLLPNIKVLQGSISSKVIVCGDPKRAKLISEQLNDVTLVADAREYLTYNGYYNGTFITISSHGVGASGAAVCFEELIKAGAKYLIRVGSAGSYQESLPPGSLIVADSAVREEGLTKQLVPLSIPAIGDLELVKLLEDKTKLANINYQRGTILTLDAFYQGVIPFNHEIFREAGILGAEMELSALYIIAKLRNVKAAGIFALDGYAFANMDNYNPDQSLVKDAIKSEISIALETLSSI